MTTPRPAVRVPQIPRLTPAQRETIGAAISAAMRRIRELFDLLRQVARAWAETLRAATAHARTLADTLNARRADRPAWASPYGPAPRRRTR